MALTGRPTKYKPEYCDKVVEFMSMGKSIAWCCGEFGIGATTMKRWKVDYPEFRTALEIAKMKCYQWWFDTIQNGLHTTKDKPVLHSGLVMGMMRNLFDWDKESSAQVDRQSETHPDDETLTYGKDQSEAG